MLYQLVVSMLMFFQVANKPRIKDNKRAYRRSRNCYLLCWTPSLMVVVPF